ncbi:MAG: hypothetical protein WB800_19515, partial [Streptosporangiaceae bacterium]
MTAADRGLGWPDQPDQGGVAASPPETVSDAALGEQAPQRGDWTGAASAGGEPGLGWPAPPVPRGTGKHRGPVQAAEPGAPAPAVADFGESDPRGSGGTDAPPRPVSD